MMSLKKYASLYCVYIINLNQSTTHSGISLRICRQFQASQHQYMTMGIWKSLRGSGDDIDDDGDDDKDNHGDDVST